MSVFTMIVLSFCLAIVLPGSLMLGFPRKLQLAHLGATLLALWLLSQWNLWAGISWMGLFLLGRYLLFRCWQLRESQADGRDDRFAIFLSVKKVGQKSQPFVLYLPPLKKPLYWVAKKITAPIPQAGNQPASSMLVPMLDRIYSSRSGFTLDTRQMQAAVPGAKKGSPAFVIRCV